MIDYHRHNIVYTIFFYVHYETKSNFLLSNKSDTVTSVSAMKFSRFSR